MCNWTDWWFRPGPEHPADPAADQIADMALHSLRWADESRHLRPARPAGVIARLEEELGSLGGCSKTAPTAASELRIRFRKGVGWFSVKTLS
jgi:hypothetical protein